MSDECTCQNPKRAGDVCLRCARLLPPIIRYVIWSFRHRAWWRAHRQGYTEDLSSAGQYEAGEAGQIITDSVMCENVAMLHALAERNGPPTVSGLWHSGLPIEGD